MKLLTFFLSLICLITLSCTDTITDDKQEEVQTITIYSGRSESLVGPIIEQFTKSTGIQTKVKYAKTAQLAATLLEEGSKSPADIFFAQDPAGLGAVEDMFHSLSLEVYNDTNKRFIPQNKKWIGVSGRARSIVYNTELVDKDDLPDDIMGFTDPIWKGKIGWAPTNGSFQAMVTAMRKVWGEEKTKQWLIGINNNKPKIYPKNTPTVKAVANGEVIIGFVNHYYLYRIMEQQDSDIKARNYHTKSGGPENLIMVSGIGILESSKNKEPAIKFIEFMLSKESQEFFASKNYEYPVVEGIKMNPLLTPLSEINSPKIKMSEMNDLKGTVDLLREAQIIP